MESALGSPPSGRLLILVTTCPCPEAFPTTTKTDFGYYGWQDLKLCREGRPKKLDDLSNLLYPVSWWKTRYFPSAYYTWPVPMTHSYPDALGEFFWHTRRDFIPFLLRLLYNQIIMSSIISSLFVWATNSMVNFLCLCKGKSPGLGAFPQKGGKNAATNWLCDRKLV